MAPSRTVALLIVAGTLSGCSYFRAVACPPLITYSAEFMAKTKSQLNHARETLPELGVLVDDYSKTRDAIRKCGGN